jgi:Condensation domain
MMARDPNREGDLVVDVRGPRGGLAAATWGQLHMFDTTRWLSPHDGHLNLSAVVDLPAGTSTDDVGGAVASVVGAHEALRTTFPVEDGRLRQQVAEAVTLVVPTWNTTAVGIGAACDRLLARYRLDRFDPVTGPVIRFGLLLGDGAPRALVVVASHLAVDGWSFDVLVRALRTALHDPSAIDARWHPMDQAAWESSESGQRQRSRALAYHRAHLPVPAVTAGAAAQREPRFWVGRLTTPQVFRALPGRAARFGVTPPSLLTAAFARALSRALDVDSPTLLVYGAGRLLSSALGSVGQYTQCAPVRFPPAETRFPEYVRAVHSRVLLAYRHCSCGPDGGSTPVDSTQIPLAINIVSGPDHVDPPVERRTREFGWLEPRERETFVAYGSASAAAEALVLLADTAVLGPDAIRDVLHAVETGVAGED